jgi:hypothetical protein
MTYRAVYAYAWDIADRGVDAAIDEIVGLGLDTITLAGAYHAGKFLRPRARNKVYFPEDGTVYFRFDAKRYGEIKPVLNGQIAGEDVLRELCDNGGAAINVWLVLLHNTRLGTSYPHLTVRNCFGDSYPYSLCPAAPQVREFAVALTRDVTDNHPIIGISLETPGYLPYPHGFHHEFALVKSNAWLDAQLGLCFCDHCRAGAAAAGIDAEGLQARTAAAVESYLQGGFDLPDDMAHAIWLADVEGDAELAAFLAWRRGIVTSLVQDIRLAVRKDCVVSVIPSVARPTAGAWYEGSDLAALAETAGTLEACFYEPAPGRVAADAWDVKRRVGGKGAIRGILRPAFPDLASREALVSAAEALRAAEITDVAFYNYGFLRQQNLDAIAEAVAVLKG